MNIRDALLSLTPNAEWTANDTEVVNWLSPDITQPTLAELDAEVVRLQAEQEAGAAQKAADKESGNQKLRDLGLTDAEIEAITR